MKPRPFNVPEVVAALSFVGLGAFMIWQASGYPYGDLRRMGPGFFPIWIGVLLIVLGLALVLEVRRLGTPAPTVALRPLLTIPAGLLAFALLVERAGLVPATAVLVGVSALGARPLRPRAVVWTTAIVTAAAYVLLIRLLGLPLKAFWW